MNRFMSLLLGTSMVLGTATVTLSQVEKNGEGKKTEAIASTREKNIEVMREIFRAIEQRDPQRMNLQRELQLVQPDVEFHWPPSLPYGGTTRGGKRGGPTWGETWNPLQPTEAERRLDPRVVAASEDEVVVLWRQRGISPAGDRFDQPVLGLYQVREGKLARAQMFYFDTAAVAGFLSKANAAKQ